MEGVKPEDLDFGKIGQGKYTISNADILQGTKSKINNRSVLFESRIDNVSLQSTNSESKFKLPTIRKHDNKSLNASKLKSFRNDN